MNVKSQWVETDDKVHNRTDSGFLLEIRKNGKHWLGSGNFIPNTNVRVGWVADTSLAKAKRRLSSMARKAAAALRTFYRKKGN